MQKDLNEEIISNRVAEEQIAEYESNQKLKDMNEGARVMHHVLKECSLLDLTTQDIVALRGAISCGKVAANLAGQDTTFARLVELDKKLEAILKTL